MQTRNSHYIGTWTLGDLKDVVVNLQWLWGACTPGKNSSKDVNGAEAALALRSKASGL